MEVQLQAAQVNIYTTYYVVGNKDATKMINFYSLIIYDVLILFSIRIIRTLDKIRSEKRHVWFKI
jgi:hypothetical protein